LDRAVETSGELVDFNPGSYDDTTDRKDRVIDMLRAELLARVPEKDRAWETAELDKRIAEAGQ